MSSEATGVRFTEGSSKTLECPISLVAWVDYISGSKLKCRVRSLPPYNCTTWDSLDLPVVWER